MITADQEAWVAKLDATTFVKILPYDPTVKQIFKDFKKEIENIVGPDYPLQHCGATGLEISGQGEIDAYIPVPPDKFDEIMEKIKSVFGKPGSHYPLERVRFNTYRNNTKIELFVINEVCNGWTRSRTFESYLQKHPKWLKAYEKLKQDGNGLNKQDYYRRKIEFINDIIERAENITIIL